MDHLVAIRQDDCICINRKGMRRRELTGFGCIFVLLVSLFLSPIYPPKTSTLASIIIYTLDVRVGLPLFISYNECVQYNV